MTINSNSFSDSRMIVLLKKAGAFVQFTKVLKIESECLRKRMEVPPLEKIPRAKIIQSTEYQHRLLTPKEKAESELRIAEIVARNESGSHDMEALVVLALANGNYALYNGNHRNPALQKLGAVDVWAYVFPVCTSPNIVEEICSNENASHGHKLSKARKIDLAYASYLRQHDDGVEFGKELEASVAEAHAVKVDDLRKRIDIERVNRFIENAGHLVSCCSNDIKLSVLRPLMKSMSSPTITPEKRKDALEHVLESIRLAKAIKGVTPEMIGRAFADAESAQAEDFLATDSLTEFRNRVEKMLVGACSPPPGGGGIKFTPRTMNDFTELMTVAGVLLKSMVGKSFSASRIANSEEKSRYLSVLSQLKTKIESDLNSPEWRSI